MGDPDICLVAELRKARRKSGVEAWSMSPSKNGKNCLQEKEPGRLWPKKAPTVFAKDCRPEINISPELGAEDPTCCMSQIGVLC